MKFQIKNYCSGTTLIELLVVIAIIALFSTIMVADFPRIQKQFALSRASYKLAQDLRIALDLGMSGVKTVTTCYTPVCPVAQGYGVYFENISSPAEMYLIYADTYIDSSSGAPVVHPWYDTSNPVAHDLTIGNPIDIGQEEPGIKIESIAVNGFPTTGASVNFRPPNPVVDITDLSVLPLAPAIGNSELEIVLGIIGDNTATKTITVNKAGLISVQ